MAHDVRNYYFSLWAIFCLFAPITAPKMKISENEKSTWRYHHFTQVYQKSWSYWHIVPEIWCVMYVIVTLHFGPFFAVLSQIKKKKLKKKKRLEISSFYTCVPKLWLDDVRFLRYGARQTCGLMDWKVTYSDRCPT